MKPRKWLGVIITNEEKQVQGYNDFVGQRYQFCRFPNIQAHNLSRVPVFLDPSFGDYLLHAGSPVINRGDGSIAPLTDFDNTLLSQYNNVEMGAYEDGFFEGFMPISLKEAQADISPTGLRAPKPPGRRKTCGLPIIFNV